MDHETIIVGGGAAGMNCAYELRAAGKPYTLICDHLGGRIQYNPEQDMNYGAVFYFGNYDNMLGKKILTPGPDVLPSLTQGCCHWANGRSFSALSPHTLGHLGSLLKFQNYMKKQFLPHYEPFKKDLETREMTEVLKDHPFIDHLYHQTADEMIEEVGFGKIAEDLVSLFAHGCTGTKINMLSALDYLNCVQGLVLPLKRFTFEADRIQKELSEGQGEVLVDDLVTKVAKVDGGWQVETKSGKKMTTENLVMATPADITAEWLKGVDGVEELKIRNACELHSYLLEGKMHSQYETHTVHIFIDSIPIIFTARKRPGIYEVFTEVPFEDKDFAEYFETFKVLGHADFMHAMFTNPNIVLPQNLAPGLIMAGDHNGLGMEPAALSGVYAANKILGKAK